MATRWYKKFEDMFIRFDMIHERDRQTDGRTDRQTGTVRQTPHDGIDRAYAYHRAVKLRCRYVEADYRQT